MKIKEFLSSRPYYGIFCPMIVSAGLKAGDLLPFFQVVGVVIGCGVGLLTGYLKILEIKEKWKTGRKSPIDPELLIEEMRKKEKRARDRK